MSTSSLTGTGLLVGLILNLPVKKSFLFETNLIYKPTNRTANGTQTLAAGVPTGSTAASSLSSTQTFISISETAKFYAENSNWWYGPGLQLDHAMSGTLTVGSGISYTYQSSDLKNLFMLYAATGYDFMSTKNFYITPSVRLGAIINGSPVIIEADVLLSGAFRL